MNQTIFIKSTLCVPYKCNKVKIQNKPVFSFKTFNTCVSDKKKIIFEIIVRFYLRVMITGVRKRGLGVANLYRYSSANEKIHIQSIENTIIYNVFSSCIHFTFMYTLSSDCAVDTHK